MLNVNYNDKGRYSVSNVLTSVKQQRYTTNHSRYLSWEHCYNAFKAVKNKSFSNTDSENLALHLAGYLASWGMYRGSSDLLKEYNYLVHKGLISLLYNSKYLPLFNIDETNFEQNLSLIKSAYLEIQNFYNSLSCNNKKFKASETLITKIMLGVYGCVPAYDRFFCDGLKYYNIQKSGNKKFNELNTWLKENPNFVSEVVLFGKTNFKDYPFMKLLDMYFWELGNILTKEKGEKK